MPEILTCQENFCGFIGNQFPQFHGKPLQTVDTRIRRDGGTERVRYPLLSLPLYLVERLPRMLDGLTAVS